MVANVNNVRPLCSAPEHDWKGDELVSVGDPFPCPIPEAPSSREHRARPEQANFVAARPQPAAQHRGEPLH
jgi:hypothetical protein